MDCVITVEYHFGISREPLIFQQIMESIVQDIMNVAEYLDDIILTCKNDAENMQSMSKDLD